MFCVKLVSVENHYYCGTMSLIPVFFRQKEEERVHTIFKKCSYHGDVAIIHLARDWITDEKNINLDQAKF